MSDQAQWHQSTIPMDGQQILVRTRHLPDGWDWQVQMGGLAISNTGGQLSATQERAISAALHEAAAKAI